METKSGNAANSGLIRKDSESTFSVPRKRRKAGLYDEYRGKVLGI
jgi:hypothetical protein